MRRAAPLLICLVLSTCVWGNLVDIQFSPGGATPGQWSYDGGSTFAFSQIVSIDIVRGGTSDTLFGQRVYVPDLVLSAGNTVIAATGPVQIKDSSGNLLLSGTIAGGDVMTFFTIAALYTEYQSDIVVTAVNNSIGSTLLGEIGIGSTLDFNLTLQCNQNFAYLLQNGIPFANGFSGSMDIIPEPTTICMLAAGILGLRRRRKV